jgi:hypothetical protein
LQPLAIGFDDEVGQRCTSERSFVATVGQQAKPIIRVDDRAFGRRQRDAVE